MPSTITTQSAPVRRGRRSAVGLLLSGLTAISLPLLSAAPAAAATDASVGVVNGCGAAYIRESLTSGFQQHTDCATVLDTASSPDGRYIAVVNADRSLAVKDGLWGAWQKHTGPQDTQRVAMGPNGMVGIINGCGALAIKTSIWGQWQNHTPCASVIDLAISPDGRYFGVINADRSLSIKDGLWGTWQQHIGAGDARDVALGPNGMVALVNGCNGAFIKTSVWGTWAQHLSCNGARSVAVSPDGQNIGAITSDGAAHVKQGLWGQWVRQVQAGDAQALFVGAARSVTPTPSGTRVDLARAILANGRIALQTVHVSGVQDAAHAKQNVLDTANGLAARRSSYDGAPGGSVMIDPRVLQTILNAASVGSLRISEIAGAAHSAGSAHYRGLAFDADLVDGVQVSASTAAQYMKVVNACKAANAVQVFYPAYDPYGGHSRHVHCSW